MSQWLSGGGGRLFRESVVCGLNKSQEKHALRSGFACALWSRFILLF